MVGQGSTEILDLVEACLDALEHGGVRAVRALLADVAEADAVWERLRALAATGLLDDVPADELQDLFATAASEHRAGPPERLGDFRLLEPIGRGGMGVVYLAEQEGLDRRVAVKLVRPDHLHFGSARERFRREAQAVARLEHPGIVPVYAVGEEGGIPYFAMEYVEGESLEDVMARVRGRRTADLTAADLLGGERLGGQLPDGFDARSSWVDVCLWVTAQAADALEYAHGESVLHRDVKPSNLMLMRGGRVRVLDFGLARADGVHSMTVPGAPLGSLPYMAPELIRGDVDAFGPKLDVYGLGLTLYELLCLRQAYDAPSGEALRARILDGVPIAPQRHNPRVGWDAETVCLKAMECDPSRRYSSAAAFAADLRRVLAHEPIKARRPGPWRRARRWAQRRPAHATALGLGGVIALGGPLLYSIQSELARRELQAAYVVADEARSAAEASLDDAIEAVDTMVRVAESHQLALHPGSDALRRSMLGTARELFESLGRRHAGDERLRLRYVDALLRAADMLQQLGEYEASGVELLRAREVAESVGAEQLRDRATLLLANGLRLRNRADEAWAELSKVLGPRGFAGDEMLQGQAQKLAGGLLGAMGEWRRASLAYQEASVLFEVAGVVADQPDDPGLLAALAEVLQFRAYVDGFHLDSDDYREVSSRAADLFRRLADQQPHLPSRRWMLAKTLNGWAHIDAQRGDYADAVEPQAEAVAVARSLVDDYPHRPAYASDLLRARYQLSYIHRQSGALDGAEVQLKLGVAEADEALRRHPNERAIVNQAAVVYGELGRILFDRGQTAEAEPLWQRCHALWRSMLEIPRPSVASLANGGVHYDHWARFLRRTNRPEEARAAATHACELHRRGRAAVPQSAFSDQITTTLVLRAQIEVELGDHDAALATLAEALAEGRLQPLGLASEVFAPIAGRPEFVKLRERAAANVEGR